MKTVDYTKIESLYNTRLSIQKNLEVLRQNGIEVSERTLYRYCKGKGIGDRLSDDELRHLIDPMQTVRQNLDLLKGQGYKIGNKKVCKILKESSLEFIMKDYERQTMNDKNTYRPSEYEKQPKTEILTTPKPTLNDIVGLDKFLSSLTPNINEDLENMEKVKGNDWQKDTKPVVEEVKPTIQKDPNPLCNLKFDFAKLMGDF
nr:MAG TPA: DNA methylase [Caudoviricetes sp.]